MKVHLIWTEGFTGTNDPSGTVSLSPNYQKVAFPLSIYCARFKN